mmetsp:Transcript_94263/g.271605  ORF Transcript_94263/g.271605 Transcript_94263/m.271605 type:complete len:86 (+) Transcript_94263:202-459(+)
MPAASAGRLAKVWPATHSGSSEPAALREANLAVVSALGKPSFNLTKDVGMVEAPISGDDMLLVTWREKSECARCKDGASFTEAAW